MRISIALFSLTALFLGVNAGVNGTTFFVVGDYGDVTNMAAANMTFDAIN
jgi:hypothetical protein